MKVGDVVLFVDRQLHGPRPDDKLRYNAGFITQILGQMVVIETVQGEKCVEYQQFIVYLFTPHTTK